MRRIASSVGQNAWLLLAVGDDRQHGGNDGYDDDPAFHYRWDSTVPHHLEVRPGDRVALWDKKRLLGASVIEAIDEGEGTKMLYSCRYCGRASIKPRKRLTPIYKCYSCKRVFDVPRTREVEVTTYCTRHQAGWLDLAGVLLGPELRALCVHPKSQLSLRPIVWDAFVARLKSSYPHIGRL
jgi:ribosomal protein L37AE/L43A